MRLPRDLSGVQLASLLRRFGYEVIRQTGSHIRLKSSSMGFDHCLTVPAHNPLKIGTLNAILGDVSSYVGRPKSELLSDLFE